jgi:hypothetical protein
MGRDVDIFFCAVAGILCAVIAHFFFSIPAENLIWIFFLGFFGGAVAGYLLKEIESGNAVLPVILGVLLVIGIGYFFILPLVSLPGGDTTDIPADNIPVMTEASGMPPQPSLTVTPVEYYTRSYQWTYNGHSSTLTIQIPVSLYEYYRQQPHDRNYAKYALSERDRKFLDRIITGFKRNADSRSDAAYDIVAFVQSLPYFQDNISTGYDEYPRYPIETLVDNGGDCEDTAILTAALLKEMNYDVVLIRLPTHMAVGVTCSGCSGRSYTYNDKQYFYLETTGNNWKVGQIPSVYKNESASVYPI